MFGYFHAGGVTDNSKFNISALSIIWVRLFTCPYPTKGGRHNILSFLILMQYELHFTTDRRCYGRLYIVGGIITVILIKYIGIMDIFFLIFKNMRIWLCNDSNICTELSQTLNISRVNKLLKTFHKYSFSDIAVFELTWLIIGSVLIWHM